MDKLRLIPTHIIPEAVIEQLRVLSPYLTYVRVRGTDWLLQYQLPEDAFEFKPDNSFLKQYDLYVGFQVIDTCDDYGATLNIKTTGQYIITNRYNAHEWYF